MKKIAFLLIFLSFTMNISAQYFLGTISNTGSTLQFKIKPKGSNITTAIGYFEFCVRYSSTINVTFSNLSTNTAGFGTGLSMSESTERTVGIYKYKRFVATVTIPSQTYIRDTEYKVFEVKINSSASPLEMQLATDYESTVPNDFYFVVSNGAGNPLVDVVGGDNLYPDQYREGTARIISLPNIVLPIELLSFQGEQTKEGNLLTWQTASEVNCSHYDLERSVDGKTFQKIGQIKAQNKAARYELLDKHPLSNNSYYRLKINDLDGESSHSDVVNITTILKDLSVKLYPNPFDENITLDISTVRKSNLTIELTDILERQVYRTTAADTEGTSILLIPTSSIASGVYVLKVSDGQKVFQQKIMKQ
jgi:hypothetical protein